METFAFWTVFFALPDTMKTFWNKRQTLFWTITSQECNCDPKALLTLGVDVSRFVTMVLRPIYIWRKRMRKRLHFLTGSYELKFAVHMEQRRRPKKNFAFSFAQCKLTLTLYQWRRWPIHFVIIDEPLKQRTIWTKLRREVFVGLRCHKKIEYFIYSFEANCTRSLSPNARWMVRNRIEPNRTE